MKLYEFIAENPVRLDKYMSELDIGVSRSYAQTLIEQGNIMVDGQMVKPKLVPRDGAVITVRIPDPAQQMAAAENIPLDIVYEDKHLIVVNKPRGMVVHPAAGNYEGTLVNGLLHHCEGHLSEINGIIRPGIVHRIDKDTTGLLMVAKDNETHQSLSRQIKQHSVTRKYTALVHHNIKEDSGSIETLIGRHPTDRKRMSVKVKTGREAVTRFYVTERLERYTLVDCVLETGRTHQIRVHMSYIGNPVVGDKTYGVKKEEFNLDGQLLHAKVLGFVHPVTGEYMEFTAELPEDFKKIVNILSKRVDK